MIAPKKNWLAQTKRMVGLAVLAGVVSACGSPEADLAGQERDTIEWPGTEVERENIDRVDFPQVDNQFEDTFPSEEDGVERVETPSTESQDAKRVYYFGDIRVESAAELKEYHRYTHVVGDIEITTQDDDFIGWPELRAVAGDLVVSENRKMARLSFPQLDRVYGSLLVNANPNLEAFSMDDLSRVTEKIYITKNFSLSDCWVQKLEEDLAKTDHPAIVVSYHNQEGDDCSEILD